MIPALRPVRLHYTDLDPSHRVGPDRRSSTLCPSLDDAKRWTLRAALVKGPFEARSLAGVLLERWGEDEDEARARAFLDEQASAQDAHERKFQSQ